jgi:hypothetical protein
MLAGRPARRQEIGPAGEILREFKETLGPAGIIETKWIHGAP